MEIHELCKSFGDLTALANVTFTLGAGERLALLGPNGAGKTTLIRCLSGRTRPDSGSIHVEGAPISLAGVRDMLGLVPQEIAVYRDLTTRENLSAFGRFYGLRRRELRDRIDWALQWTGLQDRAGELVGTFSGGMKRRVNLACGVMHSPSVLLLDEPTVGVDPQSRERIFSMLDELNSDGTSILLTTHHLDEAQARTDRIVIVDKGRVVAKGTFSQLVDETIGRSRMVTLRIDRPLAAPLPNLTSTTSRDSTMGICGEQSIQLRIDDVASQLPSLITTVHDFGYGIADVQVDSPSLHHVFLHLTGRELRD